MTKFAGALSLTRRVLYGIVSLAAIALVVGGAVAVDQGRGDSLALEC